MDDFLRDLKDFSESLGDISTESFDPDQMLDFEELVAFDYVDPYEIKLLKKQLEDIIEKHCEKCIHLV